MTAHERGQILEAVDILRMLGGQNGFSNLQPKIRKKLLSTANALRQIVNDDIQKLSGYRTEEFEGETIYDE